MKNIDNVKMVSDLMTKATTIWTISTIKLFEENVSFHNELEITHNVYDLVENRTLQVEVVVGDYVSSQNL